MTRNPYQFKRLTKEDVEKMSSYGQQEVARLQFNSEGMGTPQWTKKNEDV